MPPAETPGLTGLLTLAVGVVVVAGLYFGREVLIPVTLAVLLSFVLAPIANLLRRVHLGRILSVLLAVILALGVILLVGSLIGSQIADLAGDLPRYQTRLEDKFTAIEKVTAGRLSRLVSEVTQQAEKAAKPAKPAPAPATAAAPEPNQAAPAPPPPIPVEVHEPSPSPIELLRSVVAPILQPLGTTVIVLVVTVFVLLQREDLRDRLIRLFGSRDLHRTTVTMDDAASRLSRYFLTQLAVNAGFGAVIGVGLLLIGVPSPALWAVLAALLRFLPYVGVPIAALLPVVLAAAVSPGWGMAVSTIGLFAGIEAITGQVVEPMVYGNSTGLSPFAVVVAALFWSWLWGPIGLILSTPLTLCLVVLGRHVERLEFLDVLLGDRPALTPAENFYQRMLAGDPDEAAEQAELLLRDRPLSSYYDEVAVRGLRLAAHDAERGVLDGKRMERIREAMGTFVEDLADHTDRDPDFDGEEEADGPAAPSLAEQALPREPAPSDFAPPAAQLGPAWRSAAPVLCIAGRGPLDDAAAMMLAQLLEKHGLAARTVPHAAISRTAIGRLDLDGVAMICLAYLEMGEGLSHVRYTVRRIRQRAPDRRLLVCLWPDSAEAGRDRQARQIVGADDYAGSLRQAVSACLEAARAASREAGVPAPETPVPAPPAPSLPSADLIAAPRPA
ncbi:MAG TPA: AI-2E family transporter [Acetobacteraceae bacterium]|nr:AI-2E family transporter [Acetobacteraceae bacterium]